MLVTAALSATGATRMVALDDLVEYDARVATGQLDQAYYDSLRDKIVSRVLDSEQETVPVVTGFVGLLPNGIIESIGRGYTDFTAAMCAAGLKSRGHSVKEV